MARDTADLEVIWLDLRAQVDRLAGERQQYLEFFEHSPEPYLVTEPDGTICAANGAAVDILQRRKHHLRGKPFAALIALERRREFRRRLRALLARAADAQGSWRTIIESPEQRTEVTLTGRPIDRAGTVGGICWRLEALT